MSLSAGTEEMVSLALFSFYYYYFFIYLNVSLFLKKFDYCVEMSIFCSASL